MTTLRWDLEQSPDLNQRPFHTGQPTKGKVEVTLGVYSGQTYQRNISKDDNLGLDITDWHDCLSGESIY